MILNVMLEKKMPKNNNITMMMIDYEASLAIFSFITYMKILKEKKREKYMFNGITFASPGAQSPTFESSSHRCVTSTFL